MANYTVSARKYRPQRFQDVVGQEAVTTTLRNAIKTGKLAHAYLFSGPRGVGKTTCARIFAKTINCENPTPDGEACNQCESCKAFNEGRSFNIHELDAASNNSVEDIRKLIEQVRIPPQIGSYSVYIIDEVHMLSQAAFNAFLKTLEEPPKHAIFIMATTEKHKILPTILSRCQVFDFQRIKTQQIVEHLKKISEQENINAEDDALNIIAQKADGALRDALSIFDQLVSFTQGNLTYEGVIKHLNVLDYDYYFRLTDNFIAGNYEDNLLIFDEILSKGFDPQHFLNGLAGHFRNLLVVRTPKTLNLLEVGENIKAKYKQQVKNTPVSFLIRALDIINYFDVNYKMAKNKRLHVEMALIKLSDLTRQIQDDNTQARQQQAQTQQTAQANTKTQPQSQTQTQDSNLPLSEKAKLRASGIQLGKKTETTKETPSIKSATNGTINKLLKETAKAPTAEQPQNTESQTVTPSPVPSQVNEEHIWQLFAKYADKHLKNKPRIHTILKSYKPKLHKDTIIYHVTNELLQRDILKLKAHLLDFIRQHTGKDFDIEVEVKAVKVERKPLTPKEKYEFLLKKNPKLDEFRKKFNLDLE